MSARTRPQRSIRGRIAAVVVGTGLLGSTLIFTSVQASEMTPYENGNTWIAKACAEEPETTRPNWQCIVDKCHALYGVGSDAYDACKKGANNKLYPPPTLTATPVPIEP